MLLIVTVLCYNEIIGNGVRYCIWIIVELRVIGHTRQTGKVTASLVIGMTCHIRQLFVAVDESRPPRSIVNLLPFLALIPIEDTQSSTTDSPIHQQHVRIVTKPFEGSLQLRWVINLVDVAHRQPSPLRGLF